MRNRFCTINNLHPLMLLKNNIKLDEIPSKIKCKIHARFTLPLKFWRYLKTVLLIKSYMIQPVLLLLVVLLWLLYICISRYDFLQVFRTSLTIIGKNIFVTNFTFLIDSTKPLHPLKSQNPPSVTKVFCWCSLM